jgi:hypothetical protein
MTNPHDTTETDAVQTDPTEMTRALLERIDRTDRALRRWRIAAQVCAGAILFGAGIAAGSAQSPKEAPQQKAASGTATQASPDAQQPAGTAAAPAAQPQAASRGGSRMVGIALDLNPSGRWNSTLLAVDEDGIVYALNTAGPKPVWQRFTYSP